MQRLLTGYAVYFNRRHDRHGHLFQNRYKSILCQEEMYLLELVRYIHLNPLRSKIVHDLNELDRYPFCGHSVLMGKCIYQFQDKGYVLKFFGMDLASAHQNYRVFIKKGTLQRSRTELAGGGLVRSAGGWAAVKELRKTSARVKSDERILGDSHFVETVLKAANEAFNRIYRMKSDGYDISKVARRVSEVLNIQEDIIWASGKQPTIVCARSLFCYWAYRELGISMTALARLLKVSQPAVSVSVKRGEKIAKEKGYLLKE